MNQACGIYSVAIETEEIGRIVRTSKSGDTK